MPYITLGTASELQIVIPTVGSTDWGDTLRTQNFLKIAQHDHTGSGNGSQLSTGSIAADAITGAKIRLDNNEYLKARNAADTENINIIKVGTANTLELGAAFKNNTYITADDQVGGSPLNVWKIDGGDNLDFGTDISRLVMKHDTYIQADNSGGTPTNLLKLDTNNDLTLDPDISKLVMKNNVAIQSDNAGGTPTDMIKLDASDELVINPDVNKLVMKNNTWIQSDNAGGTPSSLIKLNGSDKIELGATVVSSTIETLTTSTINPESNVVLADNQSSATSAGVITLSANESCRIRYSINRNGDLQEGVLSFTDIDTNPAESYIGVDTGITFSVNSGALEYTSTSTGQTATMYYTILK